MNHRCNHAPLLEALSRAPALAGAAVAVLVTHPVPSENADTLDHLTRCTRAGLLDVAAWVQREAAAGGLLVLAQGQASTVDALARSVDDGACALLEVMAQVHPAARFACVRWRGSSVPVEDLVNAVAALALLPRNARLALPLVLTGPT